MNGLHIVADLYGCAPGDILVSAPALRALCTSTCDTAGLSILAEQFCQFDGINAIQDGGATGAVVLAESHLAIHTWPERNEVSLDIYVCNVTADNSLKAEKLYQLLIEAFRPGDIAVQRLWRGKARATTAPAAMAA
ncbi:MAG: adenosylmethionine decarboxylase [Betaproteobacteria bacterium]